MPTDISAESSKETLNHSSSIPSSVSIPLLPPSIFPIPQTKEMSPSIFPIQQTTETSPSIFPIPQTKEMSPSITASVNTPFGPSSLLPPKTPSTSHLKSLSLGKSQPLQPIQQEQSQIGVTVLSSLYDTSGSGKRSLQIKSSKQQAPKISSLFGTTEYHLSDDDD